MIVPESWMRVIRPGLRTLGAAAVAYFFIITLLFATAQQRVVDELAANAVGYDYNVAVRYYFGKDSVGAQRKANSAESKRVTGELRDARGKLANAQRTLAGQVTDLAEDLRSIAGAGCQLPATAEAAPAEDGTASPGAAAPSLDPGALLNAAAAVQHCTGASADPTVRRIGEDVAKGATAVGASLDAVAGFQRDIEDATDELERLKAERATVDEHSQAAAKAADSIAVMRIFEESDWLPGRFVYVPPALMAIVLAFSSGLFGALLITLVIFVYPENRFTFTRSASFFGRILLGGLIAIGVFVLLFSGVAVLGGDGGNGGSHNLMAYSAIGILSGMFSDQAAAWLSDRSVFKTQEQNALGGGDTSGVNGANGPADPPAEPPANPPAQP